MDAHQISLYYAIVIAFIVIGLVLVYFIISLIRHQRRINELYRAKILAEVTTLEKERNRLANDLHDEIGPLLSAIKFKVSSVDAAIPEDEQALHEAGEHLGDIIHRMREISFDLMPTTLTRKGFVFAVNEFINKIGKSKSMQSAGVIPEIHFSYNEIPELTPEQSINLYRIVQEIVHNCFKHAEASQLNIELEVKKDHIRLHARDNGKGFDYQAATRDSSGHGLMSLVSRTDIMNGQLYIESGKGKGTEYSIEFKG